MGIGKIGGLRRIGEEWEEKWEETREETREKTREETREETSDGIAWNGGERGNFYY